MDAFDHLPESLILLIFNRVSDVKTLIRCRSVSKRFNSLVPQTESLFLKVDCVISPESDSNSSLFSLFKSLLKSINDLFNSDQKPVPTLTQAQASPAQILSRFDRIRTLQMELPSGDLMSERGVVIKWRAEFGKTMRSCVILGFRAENPATSGGEVDGGDFDLSIGLKTRVIWTISALIAASARYYLLKDVVKEHEEMERLVLRDREGEGTLMMEKEGLRECREAAARGGNEGWEVSRTMVPSVTMRMRHAPRVQLKNGVWVECATLAVVKPCVGNGKEDGGGVQGADVEDADKALGAFGGGIYGDVVRVVLKNKSYLLEMNSF